MNISKKLAMIAASGAVLFGATNAMAGAIISGGDVMLGIQDTGALNFGTGPASPIHGETVVGLRYIPTGYEATSHGCLCEGWGVAVADTGATGYDGNGLANLTVISFVSDATSATSITELTSGELRITHTFTPAPETPDLYRVTVTIENISGVDIADLRYTRAMDWDIEPNAFSEFVTIGGTAAASAVLYANDDGFDVTNPLDGRSELVAGAVGDFVDSGPSDHGALFDFGFGALAAGDSFTFEIFYGASATEFDAFAALAAVGAEVYSLGQCDTDPEGLGLTDPVCNTFIFGFAGVGGTVVVPPSDIPIPAALPMFITGIGAGAAWLRRRKAKKA